MKNQKIKAFLFQSILIFISVFLGITAGNWNDSRKEKKRARIFLKSMVAEIKANKEKVDNVFPYHKAIGETADSLFFNLPKDTLEGSLKMVGGFSILPNWGGVKPVMFENAVYQSGMVSGVFEQVELSLLMKISKVHAMEASHAKLSETVLKQVLELGSQSTTMDLLKVINILKSDLYYMETYLSKAYDQLVQEIEKETK